MSSTQTQNYTRLVASIVTEYRHYTQTSIQSFYRIGQMFIEFVDQAGGKQYGDHTVDRLCADLTEKGILTNPASARRMLYSSRQFVTTFPDVNALLELAERGFTVTHAQLLLAVDDEVRSQLLDEMRSTDGAVISTRELTKRVAAVTAQSSTLAVTEAIDAATDTLIDMDAPTTEKSPPAKPSRERQASTPAAGSAPKTKSPEPEKPAEKSEPTKPATAPSNTKRSDPAGSGLSPMAVLKATDKGVTKLLSTLANLAIAVREQAQRGYDSDKMQRAYIQELRSARNRLSELSQHCKALTDLIDQEDRADAG